MHLIVRRVHGCSDNRSVLELRYDGVGPIHLHALNWLLASFIYRTVGAEQKKQEMEELEIKPRVLRKTAN